MEKKQLENIFSSPFFIDDWITVLKDVFGATRLLTKLQPIILPANNKAKDAYEIGSFYTTDERIIGVYLVKLNANVWLERNKVGLRELLRSVYKYDVDGALIVFEQDEKWRLSFVSEIRSIDEDGNLTSKVTEPKRYTYLLGKNEKSKTPVTRLASLIGKPIALEDIRRAFSVEALNEEFYKIVALHFYQLVGSVDGIGTKAQKFERLLILPDGKKNHNARSKIYQEFAVRLIGRTIFCWFLKVKKSEAGISLLPEPLLSSIAVKENSNYYHIVLEKLFFQTLNTPISKRISDLPIGSDSIPFLNGGLFEPQFDDYYQLDSRTGLSENDNSLLIPDRWFFEFFEKLEQYNFTIDENSVVDIEVSVDPEMLGRIFENLLAEIDPDSGETARKATGSFYTPREIVDYMATESLVQYLFNKTKIGKNILYPIFKIDSEILFSKDESEQILIALDNLKIIDPACGSGAFPMGVLQKMVMALQKLDKDANWWKARQLNRIQNVILKKQVKEKLDQTTVEYARKLGVIQNSLYGVDIQPIAAEISKLRCFLSLIVDENIDESKPNRGVEPLPNLEFKFVTADTLIKLPDDNITGALFNPTNDLDQLQQVRLDYLQSYGDQKRELKKEFKRIQEKITEQQINSRTADIKSRAYLISTWNPFGSDKTDWFDPLWMYGVNDFDIVIGNPPYLRLQGVQATNPDFVPIAKATYKSAAKGNWDMYVLFTERGYELLNPSGVLAFIQPHKFFQADFGVGIRKFIADQKSILKVVHFGAEQVFNSATNYTCLFFLERKKHLQFEFIDASSIEAWKRALNDKAGYFINQPEGEGKWNFSDPITQKVLDALALQPHTLGDVAKKIFQGIATSSDKIYVLKVLSEKHDSLIVYSAELDKELEIEKGLVKPFLMGKDVKRYQKPAPHNVVIFPYLIANGKAELMSQKYIQSNYQLGWSYLLENRKALEDRENGKMKHENFYAYIYPKSLTDFDAVKVMTRDIASDCEFTLDTASNYHTTTIYSFVFKPNLPETTEYWLGMLNSKLFWYFLQATGNVMRGSYFRFKTEYLKPFPIKRIDFSVPFERSAHSIIETLTQFILLLNNMEITNPINEFVPNQHISNFFETIIDGCVFELYFTEHLHERTVNIIDLVNNEFLKTFGSFQERKHQVDLHKVSRLYNELSHPDSEVRNRILKFPIESPDLLKPILKA